MKQCGYVQETFEYIDHDGDGAKLDLRIAFSLQGGGNPRPGGVWNAQLGGFEPNDPVEVEFIHAERQDADGAWVRLLAGEWLAMLAEARLRHTDVNRLEQALRDGDTFSEKPRRAATVLHRTVADFSSS